MAFKVGTGAYITVSEAIRRPSNRYSPACMTSRAGPATSTSSGKADGLLDSPAEHPANMATNSKDPTTWLRIVHSLETNTIEAQLPQTVLAPRQTESLRTKK